MNRILIWMALVLFPVVVYAACQGNGSGEIKASGMEGESVDTAEIGSSAADTTEPVTQEPAQEKQTVAGAAKVEEKPKPKVSSSSEESAAEADVVFEEYAFPPTVSDMDYHQKAWYKDDCLRCHETGVGDATQVVHKGMAEILLKAKCRTCHVLIPGQAAIEPKPVTSEEGEFASYAFPPMIPASVSHQDAWTKDNCLLCHESGVRGAPMVKHKGMPKLLLKAKCRSCHVQVRSAGIPGR